MNRDIQIFYAVFSKDGYFNGFKSEEEVINLDYNLYKIYLVNLEECIKTCINQKSFLERIKLLFMKSRK